MPILSILFGLLLNLVGLIGFYSTGATHYTALIPCALGLLLIICGVIAKKEHLRKHVMHVAVLVALIGFVMTVSAFGKLPLLLNHTAGGKEAAILSKIATASLCGVFFILCVRSFVRARLLKKY